MPIYSINCASALVKLPKFIAVWWAKKTGSRRKYKDYFDHAESLARLPNHRLLAMLRGRQDNVLTIAIEGDDAPFIEQINHAFNLTASEAQ